MIYAESLDGSKYMIKIDFIDFIKSHGNDKTLIYLKNKKNPIIVRINFDIFTSKICKKF